MHTRTDNRQITTTNTYDALNRIQQTMYSDGTATVNYGYDAPYTVAGGCPTGE